MWVAVLVAAWVGVGVLVGALVAVCVAVGVGGGENNQTLTKLLQQANAHPRIARIYEKYYNAWAETGGDLFCYFTSVSRWSKWGSWGIMQHYDGNPAEAPKYRATMKWATQCGQKINLP